MLNRLHEQSVTQFGCHSASRERTVSTPHGDSHTCPGQARECDLAQQAAPASGTRGVNLNETAEKCSIETISNACQLHYALPRVIPIFALFQEVTGEVFLACHHGLPFSFDMDFTYPAIQLRLSQTAAHSPVVEYAQGR